MRPFMVPTTLVVLALSIVASAQRVESDAVVTEGLVNAPIEAVWKLFATKEGIQSWMVAKTDIDLRVGGLWRTSYSAASTLDDDASIHHTILAFDPERMLAYRTIKPPKTFPFPDAIVKTWTVVYFEPAGDARTKVTVHMLGFGDDQESKTMRGFFETGNRTTIENLQKKFP